MHCTVILKLSILLYFAHPKNKPSALGGLAIISNRFS